VEIPDNPGTIIQENEPQATQRSLLWIQMSGGKPVAAKVWSNVSSKWEQVPGAPYYFAALAGSPTNQIKIDTGTGITDVGPLNGRLFLVKIVQATAATPLPVTFQVDASPAKPLKKQHDVDIAPGELEPEQLALIAYNGIDNAYQLITTLGTGTTVANRFMDHNPSGPSNLPTAANPVLPISNTLVDSAGNPVRPEFLRVTIKCIDAAGDLGYALNDEIDVSSLCGSEGTNQWAFFTISTDATQIRIIATTDSNFHPPNAWPKAGGARTGLNVAKWVIRVRAFNPS
jgi:hypothetical protein